MEGGCPKLHSDFPLSRESVQESTIISSCLPKDNTEARLVSNIEHNSKSKTHVYVTFSILPASPRFREVQSLA